MMVFETEKVFKRSCYVLKKCDVGFVCISSSSLLVMDFEGKIIKTYHIPHPSHFCFCENEYSNLIALLNTSGQLFIVDLQTDLLTEIKIQNTGEGCAPVFFNDCVYWADWNGKIFQYDLSTQKINVIEDLTECDVMLETLDIAKDNQELYVTLLNRKDNKHYLMCSNLNTIDFQKIELPVKKGTIVLGVKCENKNLFFVDSKKSIVYVLQKNNKEFLVKQKIEIPKKYGIFDESLFVKNNLLALQNRNNTLILDINTENVIFSLTDSYVSSIYINQNSLQIGCWDKGYSFKYDQTY